MSSYLNAFPSQPSAPGGKVVRSGLDIYVDVPYLNGPVGLLSNAASLTRDGRTAFQAMREVGTEIITVFAPDSGYYGIGAPREVIPDQVYDYLAVQPLNGTMPRPVPDLIRPLSALVIDIQDVGTRFHSFVHLLYQSLIACAEAGVLAVVLDRPNPLSGLTVEGPLLSSDYVPYYLPRELPIRHGLTYGELARLMNELVSADLQVVSMEGWQRSMFFHETGQRWASPAPDMPTLETALLYPGISMLECLTLSVGHGTLLPYQQIGAPYVDADALTAALNALYLPGVAFTPAWFRPSAGNYAGSPCEGVRVHVLDPQQVQCVELALYLADTVRQLHPEDAAWAGEEGAALFDALVGTARIREELDAQRGVDRIVSDYQFEAADFQAEAASYWIYE
jgi:uncharacterized protein YbbC (DUF1343 family)